VNETPTIIAHAERPLYFPGETISVRGDAGRPGVKSISVTGAVQRQCDVGAEGAFEFEFPAPGRGRHKLILEAEGVLPATVEFVVSSGELAFPRLFGTDQNYETGLFLAMAHDLWPMVPYWANRLGVSFVALHSLEAGVPLRDPKFDELLTRADRTGVTIAYAGWSYIPQVGDHRTLSADGTSSELNGNPLSLKCQQLILDQAVDSLSQYRHHPSFRYLLFKTERFEIAGEEGFDPENLERFAATVKKVYPARELPPTTDPKAWHKLFTSGDQLLHRGMWPVFQGGVWTDFMVQLQDALQAIRSDFEVGVCENQMTARGGGFWNMGMLASRGVTAHAPHCNYPHDDAYFYTGMAAEHRRAWGYQSLFLSLSIWLDLTHDPEHIYTGLFGIIKAGGTRTPTWADSGARFSWKYLHPEFGKSQIRKVEQWADVVVNDEALQSPITDMITGVNDHRFAGALEDAAHQISQLPYKDRFDLYERYNGNVPFKFAISWQEGEQERRVESGHGIAISGERAEYNPVYGIVQDWQANGYVEMILFNDAKTTDREKLMRGIGPEGYRKQITIFELEPGSLRERQLTITAQCDKETIPFVDGQPWAHYEREGDSLIVRSVPFEKQQVRLLQLVRCGRELPHVKTSAVKVSHTAVNLDGKTLWLKLGEPQAGTITVDCADWGEPKNLVGGKSVRYDAASHLMEISVDEKAQYLTAAWQ